MTDKNNHATAEDTVNKQRLQLVMDNMSECIFWKDVAGNYLCSSDHPLGDVSVSDVSEESSVQLHERRPQLCQ